MHFSVPGLSIWSGGQSPGVRPDMNDFTMDGVENNELFFNFLALSPPPDAIQEFSVQTSGLSARYGVRVQ